MRYRLRTLLILLAVGPPVLAGAWLIRHDYRALWALAGIVAMCVIVAMAAIPTTIVAALVERRRYLLERDRQERLRSRSNLFSDHWYG